MSHIAFTKFRSTNTSPTSLNDSSQGYDLGSIWINESDDDAYICLDTTISGAIWKDFSSAVEIDGTAIAYQGVWNASTNDPTLTSSSGIAGNFYVVSTPGTTNLDGTTDWEAGDWALYSGSIWEKVDNSSNDRVAKTGDTMTGELKLDAASGSKLTFGMSGSHVSAGNTFIISDDHFETNVKHWEIYSIHDQPGTGTNIGIDMSYIGDGTGLKQSLVNADSIGIDITGSNGVGIQSTRPVNISSNLTVTDSIGFGDTTSPSLFMDGQRTTGDWDLSFRSTGGTGYGGIFWQFPGQATWKGIWCEANDDRVYLQCDSGGYQVQFAGAQVNADYVYHRHRGDSGSDSSALYEYTAFEGGYPRYYFNPQNNTVDTDIRALFVLDEASISLPTVSNASNVLLGVEHYMVDIDATAASRDVTFNATYSTATVSEGRIYVIRKADSSANTVTISGASGDTINGASNYVLTTEHESVTIQSDGGTDWNVITKYDPITVNPADYVEKAGDTMTGTLNLPEKGLDIGSGKFGVYASGEGNDNFVGVNTNTPEQYIHVLDGTNWGPYIKLESNYNNANSQAGVILKTNSGSDIWMWTDDNDTNNLRFEIEGSDRFEISSSQINSNVDIDLNNNTLIDVNGFSNTSGGIELNIDIPSTGGNWGGFDFSEDGGSPDWQVGYNSSSYGANEDPNAFWFYDTSGYKLFLELGGPVAMAGVSLPVSTYTSNYTVTKNDNLIRVDDDGASGDVTITLPTVADGYNSVMDTGQVITVKKLGVAYDVIIAGNGAELIDGVNTHTISKTNQYSSLTFQCNGTSWDII